MGLETGTFISDLVATNPVSGDQTAQGDDHLRLIKAILQATFPNADKAFRFPDALAKTANYTVLSTDQNKIITGDATAAGFTLTLPTLTAPDDGWQVIIQKIDSTSNAVTVGGTINGVTNYKLNSQWAAARFVWTGTAWLALGFIHRDVDGNTVIDAASLTTLTLSGLLTMSSTSHFLMPRGTTAQRPGSPADGAFRFNTTIDLPEFADAGGNWRQPSIGQPIAGGFKNLVVTNNAGAPTTRVDVDADAVTVETSAGLSYRLRNVNLTINGATTGANGLDTGGLANSTWYAVLVIYNPTTDTTAGLLVKDTNFPSSITLPSGYTAWARVGWMLTGGSATFHGLLQKGREARFQLGLAATTALPILASGTKGSNPTTTPTWASQSVSAVVPSTASALVLGMHRTSTGLGGTMLAAPNSNYGAPGATLGTQAPFQRLYTTTGPNLAFSEPVKLFLEATTVQLCSDCSDGAYICFGWEDNI